MGLNAFGLLCDIFGFSSLSLGVWLDLKRKKTEYGLEKIGQYQNSIQKNINFDKQLINEAKLEIRDYTKNRKEEKKDLLKQKEEDISLRDSYEGAFGMEDMQEYIFSFTDGADFDPEEFDIETNEELKIKNVYLKEVIEHGLNSSTLAEESEVIVNNFFKSFEKTLTHLNKQMIFLKIGAILVILGFILQFSSVI